MTITAARTTAIDNHSQTRRRWTQEAVRELGMTTDVQTAGEILGIGRSKAYEMAKHAEFPVKILRVGRRYIVPVAAVIKLLETD